MLFRSPVEGFACNYAPGKDMGDLMRITENWKDGDEIDVCLGGTFANDKFISLINRSKEK